MICKSIEIFFSRDVNNKFNDATQVKPLARSSDEVDEAWTHTAKIFRGKGAGGGFLNLKRAVSKF